MSTMILKRLKIMFDLTVLMSMLLTTGCAMAGTETEYSVEYYRTFVGHNLPLRLTHKTTKQDAEATAADSAYYIGYFDADRKLVKVVKMFRGGVLFEHKYSYYPNGNLMRVEGKNNEGVMKIEEFDQSGKSKSISK